MVPIKQNLVNPSKYNVKCPYSMNAEGITVHNTANNASAKNEINYMISNNNSTSFHYAVDDIEIIQGVPENRNAWHAGDGGNGKGNRKYIGVEICYSTGDKSKFEKAQQNAAEFIAYKLKEKGWGIDRVKPHKEFSGKHCPHRTLDEYGWDYFLNLVTGYLNGSTGTSTTQTQISNINITYRTWDDVKNVWLPNVVSDSDYAGIFGHDVCAIYANLAESDCVYKVHTQGGSWLSEVKNRTDYAGIFNKPIDGFMIKSSDPNIQIYYQVHIRGGNWLPYVTGYNTSDNNNGYAGIIGKPIDGIRMYAKKTTIIVTPAPQPAPVPTPSPEPIVQKYYRVRKDWADSKSQKGAYTSLEGAIECCQAAGSGYHVFDWNGNCVYSYIAPIVNPVPQPEPPKEEPKVEPPKEEPKVEPTPIAVYDLDYPVKTKIVDKTKSNDKKDVVRSIKYILANNSSFDIEIAKAFFKLAPKYGIDPVMAISQSILETGWFEYAGSAVKPEHHNYCGLGVTSTGVSGGIFNTIEDGITAQLQHLYAYGCKDALNETIIDPRFKYVTRGIAPYWQNLAGRWACPGYDKNTYSTPEDAMKAENTYGQKILNIANKILATSVTDSDVEKYFSSIEEDKKEDTTVTPVTPDNSDDNDDIQIDTEKVNRILELLEKIFKFILNLFTKE